MWPKNCVTNNSACQQKTCATVHVQLLISTYQKQLDKQQCSMMPRMHGHYCMANRYVDGTQQNTYSTTSQWNRHSHSKCVTNSYQNQQLGATNVLVTSWSTKLLYVRARLAAGWVTIFVGHTPWHHNQATQANSASYPQQDGKWVSTSTICSWSVKGGMAHSICG